MNLCSLYKKFQKEKIKMTKRILSLLLAVMMILGTLVVVSAADEDRAENAWAVTILKDINVLQGLSEDDLGLDVAIKRYEMSLFITRALTGKTNDIYWMGAKNETPFTDLDGFQYAGAMTWTYNYGIILGRDAKTFDPQGYVTYQEAIAMIVRAWADHYMGGAENLMIVDSIHYPWRYIELADYLGLTNDVDPTTEYTEVLDRGSVAQLVYNLLAFDIDNFPEIDFDTTVNDPTIAESIFGLVSSDKDGDVVEVTGVSDKGVVTTVDPIADLNKSDFEAFELVPEVGSFYKIVYYTRYEVKTNPITGAAIIDKTKNDTTVVSIVKTTAEGSKYTNKPADRNFSLVYEVTKTNDKGEATEWKITGIKAGETTYALSLTAAADKVVLTIAGKDLATLGVTSLEGINKDTKAAYDEIVDSLYGTLTLKDTGSDGKVDVANITPYVFAAIYKEVVVKDKDGKDTKATTFEFAGYAVVAYTEATKTEKVSGAYDVRSFTWDDACKDADGNYKVDFVCNTANTEYVAKATASTLATAEKLERVTLDKYDIREGLANYFEIDGTMYGYKYEALLAWGIYNGSANVAEYYAEAQNGDLLATIYANKTVADDKIPTGQYKYVNAYVLDGKLVALECTTPEGTTAPSTPSTPTAEYAGIIDLADLNATAPKYDAATIKNVNGAYYLEVAATVDGVAQSKVLVYLGKATTYEFDITSSKSPAEQQAAWQDAQNKTISDAYTKLVALAGKNAFYSKDESNNYVVATDVDVTGANYIKHVGGEAMFKASEGKKIGSVKYVMDRGSEDYIEYVENVNGGLWESGDTKYMTGIATDETVWILVDTSKNTQTVRYGVPEYGSAIQNKNADATERANMFVKNGNTIVAFAEWYGNAFIGFNYTMYQEATYAIYDGSAALDMDVRDGYLYYTVKNLFTGKDFVMKVEETNAMVKELADVDPAKKVIIAVTPDTNHELLEIYDINANSIAAIASLTYGETSFEDLDKTYDKATLEARIKEQYNLSAIQAKLMSGSTANKIYSVASTGLVELTALPTTAVDYYVFFTPASGDTPASYVAFVCP